MFIAKSVGEKKIKTGGYLAKPQSYKQERGCLALSLTSSSVVDKRTKYTRQPRSCL